MSASFEHKLDLRGVACPTNFVKTRLYLDKMQSGQSVTVLLDAGEPFESVSQSVQADGHTLEKWEKTSETTFSLTIIKA